MTSQQDRATQGSGASALPVRGSRAGGTTADLALLAENWASWAGLGAGLDDAGWRSPTRLPGWTMTELYAHVARGVGVLGTAVDGRSDSPPSRTDAADYFRYLRGLPHGPSMVDSAARAAAEAGRTELVGWFAEDAPVVLERTQAAWDSVVASPAGDIALGDYVLTRLVEGTVHLLDAASAVDRVPEPAAEALARTADVLVVLAGPARFVELATGRDAGPELFPVLT
ncbi:MULTISPECIES: maleylpyruvate isomerase N-terminal domain-containing protein [Actinoalloteichus]|uniref:Mycothiol-dependent maleylpyruvate isomerase metal-binding domain-containing protein n=1 Tax=Actinoalloteichus fjordicus TaxID=1612552 RepID=A0AAC9LCY4_9PSEU|nr:MULTISPECIES: maleylpyruvate isomerase N-terminal domain-containing protein [Actinoalloteichus]APU14604.1 hypothetical protein UA74_12730 [Actinoalloteichus fjordicus]APU20572.1 hypothetical protein UA75_12810 [Actinoalloteichus sp. GBA129-24]